MKLKIGSTFGGKGTVAAGKFSNPFKWKNGKDYLVWDGDINPEGFALKNVWKPGENSKLTLNAGLFMVEEESKDDDARLLAGQLVGEHKFYGGKFGWRLIGYQFSELDAGFIESTTEGDRSDERNWINAFDGDEATFIEAGAYTKFGGGDWPVVVYGTLVSNTSADSMTIDGEQLGEEDQAYGLGVEFGSSGKVLKLGLAYHEVEANSVLWKFTDSDLFDGETNRKGWVFYASRKVATGTELKLTVFDGDGLEDEYAKSDADRTRIQADVQFKF